MTSPEFYLRAQISCASKELLEAAAHRELVFLKRTRDELIALRSGREVLDKMNERIAQTELALKQLLYVYVDQFPQGRAENDTYGRTGLQGGELPAGWSAAGMKVHKLFDAKGKAIDNPAPLVGSVSWSQQDGKAFCWAEDGVTLLAELTHARPAWISHVGIRIEGLEPFGPHGTQFRAQHWQVNF